MNKDLYTIMEESLKKRSLTSSKSATNSVMISELYPRKGPQNLSQKDRTQEQNSNIKYHSYEKAKLLIYWLIYSNFIISVQ